MAEYRQVRDRHSFLEMCQRPDLAADPRFAGNASRVKNRAVLVPLLEQIVRTRTAADWLERLRTADVPAAPPIPAAPPVNFHDYTAIASAVTALEAAGRPVRADSIAAWMTRTAS